jgi:hypothetical protein
MDRLSQPSGLGLRQVTLQRLKMRGADKRRPDRAKQHSLFHFFCRLNQLVGYVKSFLIEYWLLGVIASITSGYYATEKY